MNSTKRFDPRLSPFPGMDPYLERVWPEVHASLIVYARNAINSQLPADLQANIEQGLAVRDEGTRRIVPDVNISGDDPPIGPVADTDGSVADTDGSVAVAAPPQTRSIRVRLPPRVERHLEIVSPVGCVVTIIEFISPWNKLGENARTRYGAKQLAAIDGGISWLEIDLTYRGPHILMVPPQEIPEDLRTPYGACLFRCDIADEAEFYPIALSDSLPTLPIPLRMGEPDIYLPLQPIIDDCYRDGRYWRTDYHQPPDISMSDDEQRWIDQRLRQTGRR